MEEFGITEEDLKVKNPSISPQRFVDHVGLNKHTVHNYNYIREINFYQNLLKSAHNRDQVRRTLMVLDEAQRLEK